MKKGADESLTALADSAFKEAAQEVIERAAASGTPVIVWKDDAIQAVEPRKAQPRQARKNGQASGDGHT